eukprot:CAMPEP_0202866666 /NCGR_PEP_ID=MMETSP1391-20130828/8291_1 /ASSEMBLY_ACC=CAM_ASM_000867 /TAXON_ID=1034604 /ORGANISM="Chlamydomonas leiostraca, Strain SAG 11-49" /LENGTH=200 /DNA_ID=CAMNT_0049546637 /DNA_START=50 /DNA_END=652 /DNA_ORIENTATION=+
MTEVATKAPFEWVPSQYTQPEIHDLRGAKRGPKGFKVDPIRTRKPDLKRRREEIEEAERQLERGEMEVDVEQEAEEQAQSSGKRQKGQDGFKVIPVSGRTWKVPGERAGKVMKNAISTSWEKKMKDAAERKKFLEHKQAAVDARKEKRKASKAQRDAAEALKKANRAKSEVTQKITSAATLKKMMKNKKQKKTLRKADTN